MRFEDVKQYLINNPHMWKYNSYEDTDGRNERALIKRLDDIWGILALKEEGWTLVFISGSEKTQAAERWLMENPSFFRKVCDGKRLVAAFQDAKDAAKFSLACQ